MKILVAVNTQLPKTYKISKWFVVAFLLVGFLLGCSKPPDKNVSELEKQFAAVIPVTDMNNSLQLVVDGERTSFQSGSRIRVKITNQSYHSIYLDTIRLLGNLSGNQWVDVENAITYGDVMSLSPKGTILLDHGYTLVTPVLNQLDFSAEKSEVLVRVVMVGEIIKGETRTGQNVGAYVDIVIKP